MRFLLLTILLTFYLRFSLAQDTAGDTNSDLLASMVLELATVNRYTTTQGASTAKATTSFTSQVILTTAVTSMISTAEAQASTTNVAAGGTQLTQSSTSSAVKSGTSAASTTNAKATTQSDRASTSLTALSTRATSNGATRATTGLHVPTTNANFLYSAYYICHQSGTNKFPASVEGHVHKGENWGKPSNLNNHITTLMWISNELLDSKTGEPVTPSLAQKFRNKLPPGSQPYWIINEAIYDQNSESANLTTHKRMERIAVGVPDGQTAYNNIWDLFRLRKILQCSSQTHAVYPFDQHDSTIGSKDSLITYCESTSPYNDNDSRVDFIGWLHQNFDAGTWVSRIYVKTHINLTSTTTDNGVKNVIIIQDEGEPTRYYAQRLHLRNLIFFCNIHSVTGAVGIIGESTGAASATLFCIEPQVYLSTCSWICDPHGGVTQTTLGAEVGVSFRWEQDEVNLALLISSTRFAPNSDLVAWGYPPNYQKWSFSQFSIWDHMFDEMDAICGLYSEIPVICANCFNNLPA